MSFSFGTSVPAAIAIGLGAGTLSAHEAFAVVAAMEEGYAERLETWNINVTPVATEADKMRADLLRKMQNGYTEAESPLTPALSEQMQAGETTSYLVRMGDKEIAAFRLVHHEDKLFLLIDGISTSDMLAGMMTRRQFMSGAYRANHQHANVLTMVMLKTALEKATEMNARRLVIPISHDRAQLLQKGLENQDVNSFFPPSSRESTGEIILADIHHFVRAMNGQMAAIVDPEGRFSSDRQKAMR